MFKKIKIFYLAILLFELCNNINLLSISFEVKCLHEGKLKTKTINIDFDQELLLCLETCKYKLKNELNFSNIPVANIVFKNIIAAHEQNIKELLAVVRKSDQNVLITALYKNQENIREIKTLIKKFNQFFSKDKDQAADKKYKVVSPIRPDSDDFDGVFDLELGGGY